MPEITPKILKLASNANKARNDLCSSIDQHWVSPDGEGVPYTTRAVLIRKLVTAIDALTSSLADGVAR